MSRELRVVQWVDSSLQNGQVDRHDLPKPVAITSVGFVVEETGEYVVLSRDDMGDGDWRGLLAIPKTALADSTATGDADRAWVVLDWLAANNPAALELCPYKAAR